MSKKHGSLKPFLWTTVYWPFGILASSGKTVFLCLFLFCFSWLTVSAQTMFHHPKIFSKDEGYSSGSLSSIIKDEDGFIWLGTLSGELVRFDGAAFKVFEPANIGEEKQQGLAINHLLLDGEKIWIGRDSGLGYFDRTTEKFHRVPFDGSQASGQGRIIVNCLLTDPVGYLWVGTAEHGLWRYDNADSTLTSFPFQDSRLENPSNVQSLIPIRYLITDLHQDSILWATTTDGLLKINKSNGTSRRYYKSFPEKNVEMEFNYFSEIWQHPNGLIFLVAANVGVKVFDPKTALFSDLPINNTSGTEYFVKGSRIENMLNQGTKYLWITTALHLLQYDLEEKRFGLVLKNDEQDITKQYGIYYLDEAGRAFYEYKGMLYVYDPIKDQFKYSRIQEELDKVGCIPRMILEMEESGDLLLAAQYTQGIFKMDRQTNNWQLIPVPPDFQRYSVAKRNFFHAFGMVQQAKDSILVLDDHSGFFLYDTSRPVLQRYPHQPEMGSRQFRPIIPGMEGDIWIGTNRDGLIRFNSADQTYHYFREELDVPEYDIPGSAIWYLLIDSKGHLWIRRHQGYSIYLPEKDTFLNFVHPMDPDRIPAHIENFAEDAQGRVWMSGGVNELYYADVNRPEAGIIDKLIIPDEQRSMRNYFVESDQGGNIWFTGGPYLFKVDAEDLSVQEFGPGYGLKPAEPFIQQLRTGEMVIGHRNALSFFHPDSLEINTEKVRPYLNEFKVFDKVLATEESLLFRRAIDLNYRQNFFSIEYSAISYTMPEKVTFQYKLEGFDENWIEAGRRKYAAYTNVPGGNYTFRLRAINSEGLVNEAEYQLALFISTAWWKTIWTYLGYALLLVAGSLGIYRIILFRKLATAEAQRLKELDQIKTKLYTNITHEFRTPLTVIQGLSDQIRSEAGPEHIREKAKTIQRNGQQLLGLVNQMLELRKVESGNMPLHWVQGDIVTYIKYLVENFHSVAEMKDIDLSFTTDPGEMVVDYEPEKMQYIVSNLLSNAMKFTPEGGSVSVNIEMSQAVKGEERIQLVVKDTGIGIPAQQLPHIFDRFYQVNDSSTRTGEGTGIGLTLTRELVRMLGGTISVTSSAGAGSEFRIELPVSREAEMISDLPAIDWYSSPTVATPFPPKATQGQVEDLPLLLIIEDNPDVSRYLHSCLQTNYRIIMASDGREGIDMAIREVPDIIISDVMMPEKDGYEVCDTLKHDERTSHIPIILLTAKADRDSKITGLRRGADAYLAKPFHRDELEIRLAKLIELRQALKSRYGTFPNVAKPEEKIHGFDLEDEFMQKVQEILAVKYTDAEFGPIELCQALAMSRSQVFRKLKALTGKSLVRIIRAYRLSRGKELLKNGTLNISEVAYEVGFTDPAYFSRVFRDEFGSSPTDFKE